MYQKQEARRSLENSRRAPSKAELIISTWPGIIMAAFAINAVVFAAPVVLSMIARALYGC